MGVDNHPDPVDERTVENEAVAVDQRFGFRRLLRCFQRPTKNSFL